MNPQLVHQFLEFQADRCQDAVLVLERDREATYGLIDHRANSWAHLLLQRGLKHGDRVGLLAHNSQFYIEAYYGILKAGGVVVSLPAGGDWQTHERVLRLCQARALICGPRVLPKRNQAVDLSQLEFVIASADEYPRSSLAVSPVPFSPVEQLPAEGSPVRPEVHVVPCDRAAIIYTSGSTGDPKGVVLRHRNLVSNTQSIIQYLQLTHRDRVLVVLPFHYVFGKSLLNTHVAVGGSVVIENRFLFPQHALNTLAKSQATGLSGVPSTFAILLNRSNFAERDFPHLRYAAQAGGAMAPSLQQRLVAALRGKPLFIMYGATEASARLAYLAPDRWQDKLGSIGKAIPGVTLNIRRADGSVASVGEVGELVAQGDNIMEGYWGDPAGTAEVLDRHGYHTGDLAWRDDEGFFYIVGRSREMIKSGAHRIAPREIETVIQENELVHEVAVLGVPDEILGEAIVAIVSPRVPGQLVSDDLLIWCRDRLPAHKLPGEIRIVPSLARNSSGKIDKPTMAGWLTRNHSSEEAVEGESISSVSCPSTIVT
jgi:long-chain acyl-CoA synthetase